MSKTMKQMSDYLKESYGVAAQLKPVALNIKWWLSTPTGGLSAWLPNGLEVEDKGKFKPTETQYGFTIGDHFKKGKI